MKIPDNLTPGQRHDLIEPGDDRPPSNGTYFVNACYVYRPDEEDRRQLGKRLESVYDYVVHWEVRKGPPGDPEDFPGTVAEDGSELKSIKRFLRGLEEPFSAQRNQALQLSVSPVPDSDKFLVHASQSIHT